jgi:hypothetical protein
MNLGIHRLRHESAFDLDRLIRRSHTDLITAHHTRPPRHPDIRHQLPQITLYISKMYTMGRMVRSRFVERDAP